jgi:hypothetical protein
MYKRDELGFIEARCTYCKAPLYLSEEAEAKRQKPICLNACALPVGEYRIMQEGLRATTTRIEKERDRGTDSEARTEQAN